LILTEKGDRYTTFPAKNYCPSILIMKGFAAPSAQQTLSNQELMMRGFAPHH
jgi:hypothetical protein